LQFKRPDGESSFKLAGEKFQAAVRVYDGMPDIALQHRATVLAHASLLRCRNRWVLSAALPSTDEEINVLRAGLAEARELVDALPQEIADPTMAEPTFVRNACGLLYRYSQTCQELNERLATPDPALDADRIAKLTLAADWARQTRSAAWAQYQCDLAAKLAKNADEAVKKDARARAYAVVEAHAAKSTPVAWSDLYNAISIVRLLDGVLRTPWQDATWAAFERLFPASDRDAAAYLAQLKLDRIGPAVPTAAALREISDLLGPASDLDSPTNTKARAAWSFLAAKQSMGDMQYRAAFDHCREALAAAERLLEQPARELLNDLVERNVAWTDLPRWAQTRLATHVQNTLEQRLSLYGSATWLINEKNADRADLQYVKNQLELARSANLPPTAVFPKQMTARAWDASIVRAIETLNVAMQQLAGS
jgi:hypothetical protein